MDGTVGGGPKEGWARRGKTKMKREKQKNLLTGGSYMIAVFEIYSRKP
jgi:hypothetical protein